MSELAVDGEDVDGEFQEKQGFGETSTEHIKSLWKKRNKMVLCKTFLLLSFPEIEWFT